MSTAACTRFDAAAAPAPTIAEAVCEWLAAHGVTTAFVVAGVQIEPLLHALSKCPALRVIAATHELGAAYMADGYARAQAAPCAVISIGGPGASNMLTAATTARLDRSPVLFITGRATRATEDQGGFQDAGRFGTRDAEHFELATGCSLVVRDGRDLAAALAAAADRLGRHLPAHISISLDVQNEPATALQSLPPRPPPTALLDGLTAELDLAVRPLIYAGTGLLSRRGADSLRALAEAMGARVVTTLGAKGVLAETHPLSLGNAGFAGSPAANRALLDGQFDTLVTVGADLHHGDVLNQPERVLGGGRTWLRLDCVERPYPNGPAPQHQLLVDDLPDTVATLARRVRPRPFSVDRPAPSSDAPHSALSSRVLLERLRQALPSSGLLVVDGGFRRVHAGRHWRASEPLTFFSASTVAPLGWGVAAAVGCALASPHARTVAFVGDGAMAMHGMEIAVAARERLPVTYVLVDNGGYGEMLRRLDGSPLGATPAIDWLAFARALGVVAFAVTNAEEVAPALASALDVPGPAVVLARIPGDAPEWQEP